MNTYINARIHICYVLTIVLGFLTIDYRAFIWVEIIQITANLELHSGTFSASYMYKAIYFQCLKKFVLASKSPKKSYVVIVVFCLEKHVTCKPAFVVSFFCIFYPSLVPGVSKVNEEDELNQNKDEGPNSSKVKPHCSMQRQQDTGVRSSYINNSVNGSKRKEKLHIELGKIQCSLSLVAFPSLALLCVHKRIMSFDWCLDCSPPNDCRILFHYEQQIKIQANLRSCLYGEEEWVTLQPHTTVQTAL